MEAQTIQLYDKERIESVRKAKIEQNAKDNGMPVDFLETFKVNISAKDLEIGGAELVKKVLSSLKRQIKKLIEEAGSVAEVKKLIYQLQANGSSSIYTQLLQYSDLPKDEIEYLAHLLYVCSKNITPPTKEQSYLDVVRQYAPIVLNVDYQEPHMSQRYKGQVYCMIKNPLSINFNNKWTVRGKNDFRQLIDLPKLLAKIYLVNALESFADNNPELYEYLFAVYFLEKSIIEGECEGVKDTLMLPEDKNHRKELLHLYQKHNLVTAEDLEEMLLDESLQFDMSKYLPLETTKMDNLAIQLLTKEFIQKSNQIRFKVEMELSAHKDYASAYQTKKHINKETLAVMNDNAFLKKYKYVELDNDVQLENFKMVAKEFTKLCSEIYVPVSNGSFRVKKLGKHKAAGIRFSSPIDATIVDLDYFSSFCHELGHQLDETFLPDGKIISEQMNFRHIADTYRKEVKKRLDKMDKSNPESAQLKGKSKFNLDYYFQLTEIMARSFEIYLNAIGIRSSLLKAESVYKDSVVYPRSKRFVEKVVSFFTRLFEGYKPDTKAIEVDNEPKAPVIRFVAQPVEVPLIDFEADSNGQLSLF